MKIFIFGNGNINFDDFEIFYKKPLEPFLNNKNTEFILCDFRGTDTLVMELLKNHTSKVIVYHIGKKPRYYPDKYKTKVSQWTIKNGFISDEERDLTAINDCTHFLAKDFNSNKKRVSDTQKNIQECIKQDKINILHI